MSMADDAPPAMPRSEPFGMMHEHEPDPTYAASNHDARRLICAKVPPWFAVKALLRRCVNGHSRRKRDAAGEMLQL